MSNKKIHHEYDNSAEFYNSRYKKIQEEKYEIMSEYFPKNWNLALDLGCGTGLLLDKLKNVIGLDISFEMLKKVKNGEKIIQADCEAIPFKDNTFDVIFSFTTLQNSSNLQKSINEIRRVLKPDGRLIITYLRKKFNSRTKNIIKSRFKNMKKIPCSEDIGLICF